MIRVQLLIVTLILFVGIGCSESSLTNPEYGQYKMNSISSTTSLIDAEDAWTDAYKIDFNDRTEYGRRITIEGLLGITDKNEGFSEFPIHTYTVFGKGSPYWGRVPDGGLMDGDVLRLSDADFPYYDPSNPKELEQTIVEITFPKNVEKVRMAVLQQPDKWFLKPPSLTAYNSDDEEIDQVVHSWANGSSWAEILQVSDPDGSISKIKLSITNHYTIIDNIEILFAPVDPKSQLMDVSSSIDAMIGSELTAGKSNALSKKLKSAITSLEQDNSTAAINKLNAFINQINALIRSKKITDLTGEKLIKSVISIQELIREA